MWGNIRSEVTFQPYRSNFFYPFKQFIERIVATVRTIPSKQEISVLAGVLEFRCKVNGNGESCIAVTCSMTDIPM